MLLENDNYDEEIKSLEMNCNSSINIDLSVLKDEVAVNITDEGYGFRYEKHLRITEQELLENLEKPNGRGIIMASKYFDSVSFSKGGSSVLVSKKFN